MIIGDNRERVIQNIKRASNCHDWAAKVEVGDPVLTLDERKALVNSFWQKQNSFSGKVNNWIGHALFTGLTYLATRTTTFTGLENLADLPQGGAIITANHFNQLDSLPINRLAHKTRHHLSIVIEDTNLKLPGILRYFMNYVGSIPLVSSPNYVGKTFPPHLHDALSRGDWVLIFPEQEMWWNYRKVRPPQRGAYYFAAVQNVPIISTFIEIQSCQQLEKRHANFYKTKYIVHVLPPIYPQTQLSINDNSKRMMAQDYQQKKQAYEQAYHRKLDYTFTPWDIAGWHPAGQNPETDNFT